MWNPQQRVCKLMRNTSNLPNFPHSALTMPMLSSHFSYISYILYTSMHRGSYMECCTVKAIIASVVCSWQYPWNIYIALCCHSWRLDHMISSVWNSLNECHVGVSASRVHRHHFHLSKAGHTVFTNLLRPTELKQSLSFAAISHR